MVAAAQPAALLDDPSLPSLSLPSLPAAMAAGADSFFFRNEFATGNLTGQSAQNQPHQLAARVTPEGLRIERQDRADVTMGLSLRQFGCPAVQKEVSQPAVTSSEARLQRKYLGLTEWLHNGPSGIEHGFTVPAPATGCAAGQGVVLRLALRAAEGLDPQVDGDGRTLRLQDGSGQTLLRYSDLSAVDADGRALPAKMQLAEGGLVLWVDDHGARYPLTIDPLFIWRQESRIVPATASRKLWFGKALAMSGDTLVVSNAGSTPSAYVYVHSGGTWTLQAELKPNPPTSGYGFGSSVAIAGDTIVVGAAEASDGMTLSNGAAFVFVRSGTTWTQQARLLASDPENNAACGGGVTLDGNTLVVGCYYKDDGMTADVGAAYVFTRSGTAWSEQAKIVPSDGIARLYFGLRLSLSGDTLAVGGTSASSTRGTGTGATYVYLRSGSSWSQQAKLVGSDIVGGELFGSSVAVAGDTLLVGAPYHQYGGKSRPGAAYVFTRSAGTWSEQQKLTTAMPIDRFYFGVAVALAGDHALVGGFYTQVNWFYRVGSAWSEQSTAVITGEGYLGTALAVTGTASAVSAYQSYSGAEESGAVYTFAGIRTKANGQTCVADLDCESSFCTDGVCCDQRCGGTTVDCQACSTAAGAMRDGSCMVLPSTATCRPAMGDCDLPEQCSGTSTSCPFDTVKPSTTVCRAAAGTCDYEERCSGVPIFGQKCPFDSLKDPSEVCRASAGACDVEERCSGTSPACPSDAVKPATTVCRASAGVCDPEERCSGTTGTCPADALSPPGTVCRAARNLCDAPETCGGPSGADCPADTRRTAGTVCRPAIGACDVAEFCDGLSDACPLDSVATAGTVCRPAVASCDKAEVCSGSAIVCPPDGEAVSCQADADLAVTLAAAPTRVAPGSGSQIDVQVRNAGKSSAAGVEVILDLPPAATAEVVSAPTWTCQSLLTSVVCIRALLAVESAPVISLRLVLNTPNSAVVVSASVHSATPDPTPGNNTATVALATDAAGCACRIGRAPAAPSPTWLLPGLLPLLLLRRRGRSRL